MSRKAAGKVKSVLEAVELDPETIRACISGNPNNDEEAVQDGLIKWKEGQSTQPPTWAVLVETMEYARIDQDSIQGLKEKLLRGMLFVSVSSVCTVACAVYVLCMAPYKSTFDMECV